MRTTTYLDVDDLANPFLSYMGHPCLDGQAYVVFGADGLSRAALPLTATDARRIAASFHALADEIDRRVIGAANLRFAEIDRWGNEVAS